MDARDVKNAFISLNYVCDVVDNEIDGILLNRAFDYYIIVIDFMNTNINVRNLIRGLKSSNRKIPILIITSCGDINTKLKVFAQGVDDYLVKPFDNRELIARVQAIVRRSKGFSSSIISYSDITINLSTSTAEFNEKPLSLTKTEYKYLELLILCQRKAIPRATFLDHHYGRRNNEPDYKAIDVIICRLRKKLKLASDGIDYIKTISGIGYILRPQSQLEEYRVKQPNWVVAPI